MTLTLAKLLPASSRTTGDAFWLEQTRTVHTATAAAYGVLTVTDATQVESRLRGGTVLQRIHLAATAQGLGLQHMNQVTEAIDRQSVKGMPATFAPRFARLLGDAAQPLVTFRVGVPVRSARPSPRRRLADVTA
jgi:ribosomal protein L30/L7E